MRENGAGHVRLISNAPPVLEFVRQKGVAENPPAL
jgi:hypothetical protein